MCSFATIYGLVHLLGGKFRMGLTYDQFFKLSEIFPYFEEKNHLIESMYCGKACDQMKWEDVRGSKTFTAKLSQYTKILDH